MSNLKNLLWLQFIALSLFIVSCDSFGGGGIGNQADLKKLEGNWIRVESNAPRFDFMKVRMSGSSGTVTDKASSDFNVGDVKWDNIVSDGGDVFSYQELGNDGNYYDATITLISDDEIRISVASSGSGNDQKWLRDDGTIVPDVGTTLDCSGISTETTFSNGPAAIDYIVPQGCVLDITARLNIEAGTVIAFEENAGLGIYDAGVLNVVGTESEPVIFKGSQSQQGWWRGIHVETSSVNNRLEHVQIQDAGSNYVYCCNEVASLFLKGAKMTLQNVSIQNGESYGIYANKDTELPDFSNVNIDSHKEEPMAISILVAQYLDGATSDYTGNDKDFILLLSNSMDEEMSIPANNVPYLLEEKVFDIVEGLTIEAGVEFVMKENSGLGIYDDGYLKIDGTSSLPVVIRGEQSVEGYWRGIHIETNSLNNKISYAEISEAGSNYVYCCNDKATVFLKAGKLAIDHTSLSNGAGYGLLARADAELRAFDANTISSHSDYPLYLALERAGELDGLESNFSGNTLSLIHI